ncbi:MAG TPA: hypothetical protein VKR31_11360 [Rhizomicrobium sp.]|nr:hypothetical protein [Rhizomicrobium sp.]
MNLFASAALGALALISAAPALAGFSGEYTMVFYSGPTHEKTGTECVTFTNTGNILGFPDSGTWTSSTLSGWGGNFVVDGKTLRWYGTLQEATAATNAYNKIKNDVPGMGGFDEWNVSNSPITAVNDGTQRLRPGCRSHQPKHFGSPAHSPLGRR